MTTTGAYSGGVSSVGSGGLPGGPSGASSGGASPPRDLANNGSPWEALEAAQTAADQRFRGQERRSDRYRFRAGLWEWSSLGRVRHCGRVVVSAGGGVGLRLTGGPGGFAGFAGLQSCGSVWADPVCSSKVLARRAVEVGSLLALAAAEGCVLGFGTFTMRHRAGEPLAGLWGAARVGWRRATKGKAYVVAIERCGVEGWVRVWEVTEGRNGWHVHVHWVVVLESGSCQAQLDDLAEGMLRRWRAGLAKSGREALRVGQEWHLVTGDQAGEDIGRYVAKLGAEGLGLELAYSQSGRARGSLKTRSVWALLGDFFDDGDARALPRWHEWERVSKGARQIGYSRGLRERFRVVEPEKSDEEIVAEELGTAEDTLLWITRGGWASMVRCPARMPDLLSAAENGGLAACRGLLDSWGDVEYTLPAGSK